MALAVNSALVDRPTEARLGESATTNKRFDASLAQSLTSRATPIQRTQISASTASVELRRAWTRVTGEVPDDKTVALITAQWAHETGHGASMYNYNFGGIKGVGPTGLSVEQRTKEGFGSHERQITDRFRAYESAEAGAEDYVKLLTRRFPEAVNAAKAGDSAGFVHGLKQRGYFTGDAQVYERSVTSIANHLLADSNGGAQSLAQFKPIASGERDINRSLPQKGLRESTHAVTASPRFDSSLVQPLMPTTLMSALSGVSSSENSSRGLEEKFPLDHVSTLSMVDEVLRASLQLAASEGNSGRSGEKAG